MTYVGIAIAVAGLASVYFLAGTNWIYLGIFLSALGGAIFGVSLKKDSR